MSMSNWDKRRVKHVTSPTSKDALAILRKLLIDTPKDQDLPPRFYHILVLLTSQIQHGRFGYYARRHLRQFFSALPSDKRKTVLEGLLGTDKSLLALGYAVTYMEKYKILEETLGQSRVPEFRKEVVAKYIREVILSKESESEWIVTQISQHLLSHVVSSEDFGSVILPACQKAMLRSPETSIQRVAATLSGLNVDLSDFSADLGKMFATSLHSTDDLSREHALTASRILAKKIQQPSAVKTLVERYFAVLNGAEGKLTVAVHKISILRAIGEISYCVEPSEAMSQVATYVFDTCIKALDVEVHEGTLIEYLNVMTLWCKPLVDHSVPSFQTYVSKGLTNLKGPVRTSFCRLIATYFYFPRNKFLTDNVDPIQKAFEKMSPQLFQGSNLLECLCLGLVLMVAPSGPSDSLLLLIRCLPQHVDRKLVDSDALGCADIVATFAQRLIQDHYEKVRPTAFDALTLAATVKQYEARKKPKDLIKEVLQGNNCQSVTLDVIRAFERNVPETNDNVRMEILRFLGSVFKELLEGEELEVAALELLPLSIGSRPNYWLSIVQLMGLRPDKLVGKYWTSRLMKYVTDEEIVNRGPILETLSLVHGEVVVEKLVEAFQDLIKGLDYKKVTRDEYFIYHTPEGQLFDNSVLETHEFDVMGNMKRESKAYSYKEQLEEINLRKELEKKRKEAGKEPKLTQKQKDVMKSQLEKEDLIRKNVRTIDHRLQSGFLLINSALKGNVGALGFNVKDFLGEIIDLMSSPLSSPYAVKFYLDLGTALFRFDKNLGEVVSNVSIKAFNPQCDLSHEYETVKLEAALPSLLTKLVEAAKGNEDFNAANYAFIFPFFKQVIHSRSKTPSAQVMTAILDCTMAMLKARANGFDHSPEFIPRRDLTQLLYHLIGTTEHRVQQTAVNVLLELAKSCGEPLSPDPDSEELEVHLKGFHSHLMVARDAALRAMSEAYPELDRLSDEDQQKLIAAVFQLCYDQVPEIEELAKKIWATRGFEKNFGLHELLLKGIADPCLEIRTSAAKALGALMEEYAEHIDVVVADLLFIYEDFSRMTPPVMDDFGRVLQEGVDTWEGRHGAGLGVNELAKWMPAYLAMSTMKWLVSTTFLDRHPTVHMAMLDAALNIVQLHGKECMEGFATLIESHLDQPGDSSHLDRVRQSCVVLMGCLARHIDPKDPRVKSIFMTLLETLSTPSEKVQEAVANCLPALVPAIEEDAAKIVDGLIKKALTAEVYGQRRGAAYGLAGIIKGLGVLSLKQFDIMNVLAEGMQDKKNFRRREGALMALELLCDFLGRLFEPYIVHVLPYLLQCLGDGNQYVREATENTARAVMSRLSGHGVKLVLPALLTALNEDSWRTKCGSVDLLGRMAYCAPKQLSGCLPMIVPHLIEVLGDSHVKVQDSAAKALSVIGSVIRNPEIQTVVPVLLQALQDPAKKTTPCLNSLLKTEFVHMVDSPSLALIMPVVERAFLDRSTENRRLACQIIGNMFSLTDHKDLAPYLKNVMPGIRASLLDPVPEVRTVAAKALGSMTRGMGEKSYDDLLPWLMKTLVSETNSVDRSGAAQGLSEVIGALGVDKLERFMPEIIRKADSDDIPPHVRDGYMMMFIYMPTVFENDFVPYIGEIINPILKALADENEFVRETALRAGQRIVTGYADTAILLLLPQLRQGIFDDNWRIRYSSVQLLGDLLYKISGVSGKMSTESAGDDDNFGTEGSQTLIIEKLGQERRDQILAGLYLGRSDVALMVRQAALHVWKVIVANTPKTLREILPTLFSLILNFLASGSHDKRHVAARTLGDLVRKLGEKILPEIIPILEKGLECPRPEERQGVCIGLSEIMAATSKEMVLAFVENLVPTLRKALCDPVVFVRRAAAQTFGSLHTTVGTRALDEILPFLLKKLEDEEEGSYALDGLCQVLQAKSKAVMPYLIPQLIAPPANLKALGILCSVAGEALSRQLPKIFPVLVATLKKSLETSTFDADLSHCENVLLSVEDELGVRLVIEDLLDCCKHVKKGNRVPGVLLLSSFLAKTKADIKPHVGTLLRALILLMIDPEPVVINATADAIPSVLKHVGREDQMDHVEDIRQAIRFARSDLKDKTELPGLTSVKAVKALLGVFREAILNGPPEVKEQGANGMSELVVLANAEALKPSVIHVTGPLIRILGDRYAPDVKVAVLDAIAILLPKVGPNLRAFLPQLQITFQKAVNDENRNVRAKAEFATTQLVYVQGLQPPPTTAAAATAN